MPDKTPRLGTLKKRNFLLRPLSDYRYRWSKLIEHITAFDDLTASFAAHGMTTSLKKGIKPRFSRFNDDFEAIFNAQVGGEIPDVELRSSLRHENIERVVPAYTAFYNA